MNRLTRWNGQKWVLPQGVGSFRTIADRLAAYENTGLEPDEIPKPGKRLLTLSSWALRDLCIKNQWFTGGTNEQYNKLFYALENRAPFEEIVTMIWLCSDGEKWCRRDICNILSPYAI